MRTNSWRSVVAVAVLLVAAGACGNGSGGGSGAAGDRPKLPTGSAGGAGTAAAMAPTSEAAADASTKSMMPFRAVEYRLADGAKVPATSATAYVVKPAVDDIAAKVAKALDVDKADVAVGTGGYEWYFSGANGGKVDLSSPVSGVAIACAPDGACPETPTPTVPGVPSAGDAERRAKALLRDLDVPLDGRFEVFGEDGYSRTVVYSPTVKGVRTLGLETTITFGEQGRIQYANGTLAELDGVGDYPLVSLDVALHRLQDGFGNGGVRAMGAATAGDTAVSSDAGTSAGGAPSIATGTAASGSGTTGSGTASSGSSPGSSGGTATGGTPASGSGSSGSGTAGSTGTGGTATDPTCAADGGACNGPAPDVRCQKGEPCSVPPSPPTDEPPMTIEPEPTVPTVPLEPQVVEITGADLVLQVVPTGCPGDPVYLVPTFELQPGPAGSVTAVADDALATSDPAASANPCPDQPPTDVPLGKPEPAAVPPDTPNAEPATP